MSKSKPLTKEEREIYAARAEESLALYCHGNYENTTWSWILSYEATVADLERQLEEAHKRIATLENALGPILADMDKAEAKGSQYMPLPPISIRVVKGQIVSVERPAPHDMAEEE